MKSAALLIALAATFHSQDALACWSCEGSTEAECQARIEDSRQKTAEQIARDDKGTCRGKAAGILPMGFGLSTAGSFTFVCDGDGGGCLHWTRDDMGQVRDKFYPLGGDGTCDAARAVHAENQNKPLVAEDLSKENIEYVDEKGNRVVLLDENVAAERKRNHAPASVEVGIPIEPAKKAEKQE